MVCISILSISNDLKFFSVSLFSLINFREENERLNVFLAWLNLENSFGTEETLGGAARLRNRTFRGCDRLRHPTMVSTPPSGKALKPTNSEFNNALTAVSTSGDQSGCAINAIRWKLTG